MFQSITLFGQEIDLYNFFNNLPIVGQLIFAILVRRRFSEISTLDKYANLRLNKKKNDNLFWRWFFLALIALLLSLATTAVNNLTGKWISLLFLKTTDGNYFPNIFVWPITIFLLSILLKTSPLKTTDLFAPMAAIALIHYKIACFSQGCCYGVESAVGLWNNKTGRKEIPIQLIEAACAVVMLVILLILTKKNKHKAGLLYPLFMLMYSGSRFISEFWRDDYPNVLGPLKAYHIQCILGFIEGLIFIFVVLKWGEKITVFFENKNKAFLERAEKKQREKRQREKKIVHSKKRRK